MDVHPDPAGVIRRYLRSKTGTALNVRKAGPNGTWVDIRGSGPAGTFRHEELPVVCLFIQSLGLRISPTRDFATLSPTHVARALEIIKTHSEARALPVEAPGEVADGVSTTPCR